jgi:hypothetical protein
MADLDVALGRRFAEFFPEPRDVPSGRESLDDAPASG